MLAADVTSPSPTTATEVAEDEPEVPRRECHTGVHDEVQVDVAVGVVLERDTETAAKVGDGPPDAADAADVELTEEEGNEVAEGEPEVPRQECHTGVHDEVQVDVAVGVVLEGDTETAAKVGDGPPDAAHPADVELTEEEVAEGEPEVPRQECHTGVHDEVQVDVAVGVVLEETQRLQQRSVMVHLMQPTLPMLN